jgi:hypothetical protein
VIMSRDEHPGKNNSVKMGNNWEVGRVEMFGGKKRIKSLFLKEAKADWTLNVLSSSWLSNNIKIKIYRTIILPVVLYGCETWSVTLREKHRLRVFESGVLRMIFGPKRDELTREWRRLRYRSFMICTCHEIFWWSNEVDWEGRCM